MDSLRKKAIEFGIKMFEQERKSRQEAITQTSMLQAIDSQLPNDQYDILKDYMNQEPIIVGEGLE